MHIGGRVQVISQGIPIAKTNPERKQPQTFREWEARVSRFESAALKD